MSSQTPCTTWAEKLALRGEDLVPADRAALDAHIQTCPACEAVQEDYNFLDSRLRALPPPALKPLPRLPLQTFIQDKDESNTTKIVNAGNATNATRLSLPIKQRAPRARMVFSLSRVFPVAFVACLMLTFLLFFRFLIVSNTSSQPPGTTIFTYKGHSDYVDAVAWSPNNQFIASGSWDGTVQVWDAHTGAIITTYKGHTDVVSALAWSPDGNYIASGSWDGTVRVWDAFSGSLLTFYDGHADPVSALGWSPDGQYIASGSWDHTVQVWYAHTGETISIYRGHREFVDAVAWSPNGQYIASGDRNNTVLVWNALTGKTLNYFTEEYTGGIIEALAWSPDGRFIASGSRDKTIRVWEAFTGKLFLTYKGHTDEVSALAWSPNGRYIASGSWDHTVQVWVAPSTR